MNPRWLENNIIEMKASIDELKVLLTAAAKAPAPTAIKSTKKK
jgi:hypothetical protein